MVELMKEIESGMNLYNARDTIAREWLRNDLLTEADSSFLQFTRTTRQVGDQVRTACAKFTALIELPLRN